MRHEQILNFIKSLSQYSHLSDFDQKIVQQLTHYFQSAHPESLVSEQSIDFLLSVFKNRWTNIFDTKNDYTFKMTKINTLWFNFAKSLSAFVNKAPLQILMPSIEELKSPDNFLRLGDMPSPQDLYISNNGKSWHSVKFLVDFDEKKRGKFSLFDFPNISKRRMLSLKELYRLKQKESQSCDVWNFIYQTVRPVWCEKGSSPDFFLQDLFELVESYSENDELAAFKLQINILNQTLVNMPYDKVARIFGTAITKSEKPLYLYEVLASCFEGKAEIKKAICHIASWINSKNSSMVCKNKEVRTVYQDLQMGPFYNLEQLKKQLNALSASPHQPLDELLLSLKFKINQPKIGLEDVLDDIKRLYAARWKLFGDKNEDYFSMPGGVNEPWICLAQSLQGAGLLKGTFYQLLVASVQQKNVPILDVPVSLFKPDAYILSDEGNNLIYLQNCEKHFKAKGTFYHCISLEKAIPLTEKEKQRLLRAKIQYRHYGAFLSQMHLSSTPISKRTVEAIKNLVNDSLHTKGWLLGKEYEEMELNGAESAYLTFSEYLHGRCCLSFLMPSQSKKLQLSDPCHLRLYREGENFIYYLKDEEKVKKHTLEEFTKTCKGASALKTVASLFDVSNTNKNDVLKNNKLNLQQKQACEYVLECTSSRKHTSVYGLKYRAPVEYNNLLSHYIIFENNLINFSELMSKIQNSEKRDCVAVYSKYFMKLVIDYETNAKFSHEIKSQGEKTVSEMRKHSANLVYLDYAGIKPQEIKRRLFLIMLGLLFHPFQLAIGTGHDIACFGFKNRVTNTGKLIFDLLFDVLDDGNQKDLARAYQSIMMDIIPSSLKHQDTWSKSFIQSSDTLQWYKSILDRTCFLKTTFYFPDLIFKNILLCLQDKKLYTNMRGKLFQVMDKLLFQYSKDAHPLESWLVFNTLYVKILSWDLSSKPVILKKIKLDDHMTSSLSLCRDVLDYLAMRFDGFAKKVHQEGQQFHQIQKSSPELFIVFKKFVLKEQETVSDMLKRLAVFVHDSKEIDSGKAKKLNYFISSLIQETSEIGQTVYFG